MDPDEDAYGQAIRDYHERAEGFEIIERDDGHVAPSAGPAMYFSDYDEWGTDEQTALDHLRGSVLDIGCGAGRHGLYAQRQGHDVTGIDVSPGAVEVSRDRGLDTVEQCDVIDVADVFVSDAFETVLMLGANFGLVGTAETAPDILDGLATVTTEDGRILAQSRDPHDTDDPHHREYHAFNRDRGRFPGALRMRTRYKTFATPWFDYLLVSPTEMDDVLEATVWTRTETWAGDGGLYTAILEKER
ncbi:class I SAM-dependent methyltransferase [Halorhabdus sp. BNX81]|uniref:class I SAM-dependent methyltransferase n=1 Tax=Halorhabdus sp. BNX81 TaxID=2980181 RepID=UPI0023DD0588|nr:class I SAM-dependent methyltransferase [Halorhabdus sp. BNX81]WEL20768.1 SAM-dependent methyltransferase [Halorhabdus sp. BNX81]